MRGGGRGGRRLVGGRPTACSSRLHRFSAENQAMGQLASHDGRECWTFAHNTVEAPRVDLEVDVNYATGIALARFHAPNPSLFREFEHFNNQANKSFFVRVYYPEASASEVVIMFNGLDETLPQLGSEDRLFQVYDAIGRALAERGVLVVLLPHPYHMNRFLAFKDEQSCRDWFTLNPSVNPLQPTSALIEEPAHLYRNHFQAHRETMALVRFLRGPQHDHADLREADDEVPFKDEAATLIRSRLDGHSCSRISLIGYSLGGLRALSAFLRDRILALDRREPFFNTCVCVNSGGGLTSLPSPFWVNSDDWERLIQVLRHERLDERAEPRRIRGIEDALHEKARLHFRYLDDVFLGQGDALNILGAEAAKRMLFVVGGDDTLVPLESLERFVPSGGLNILQIAGMGHILGNDEAWQRWKKVITTVVTDFVKDPRHHDYNPLTASALEIVATLDAYYRLIPEARAVCKKSAAWVEPSIKALKANLGKAKIGAFGIQSQKDQEIFVEFYAEVARSLRAKVQLSARDYEYERYRSQLWLGAFLPESARRVRTAAWRAAAAAARRESMDIGAYFVRHSLYDQAELDEAIRRRKAKLRRLEDRVNVSFRQYKALKQIDIQPVFGQDKSVRKRGAGRRKQ